MAKTTGPLFSLEASGTIGKALTYGRNQKGNYAKAWAFKKFTRTELQDEARTWFKLAVKGFGDFDDPERFLWKMALRGYREYKERIIQNTRRWAKCLFLHRTLTDKTFWWNGSPFPPSLTQMFAADEVARSNQLADDLETLTKLEWGQYPKPFFFPYLGSAKDWPALDLEGEIMGIRGGHGGAYAITEPIYRDLSEWEKDQLMAHELTHCLLKQHRGIAGDYYQHEETICEECGNKVADGDLTPVYTFDGKTLSQLVADASFDWYNYCKDIGYIE